MVISKAYPYNYRNRALSSIFTKIKEMCLYIAKTINQDKPTDANSKKCTAWKVSKYVVFSGPCFSVFGLNTEIYSIRMHRNTDQEKLHIWTLFRQCRF